MTQPAPASPIESPVVTVGGRSFRASTTTTFRQDMHIMVLVRESGLGRLAGGLAAGALEIDRSAEDIVAAAFASGKLFALLGAVMEEVGVPWSIEESRANAEFFANLRDANDKAALRGSIVAVILGFFVSGLVASTSSPRSSESLEPIGANDGATAAPSMPATGPGSSGSSRDTNTIDMPPSSSGPSGRD